MINLTFNVACYKWYILTVQETKRQVVICTILHQTLLFKSSNNSRFTLKKDYATNPPTKLCFDPPVWNTKRPLVKVAINLVWNTKFNNTPKQNRNRCRNITRWNPRFDKVATTGIEKRFLRLLEKQVAKSRNTIKVNISGMETASWTSNSQNKQVFKTNKKVLVACNCRNKNEYPISKNCFKIV